MFPTKTSYQEGMLIAMRNNKPVFITECDSDQIFFFYSGNEECTDFLEMLGFSVNEILEMYECVEQDRDSNIYVYWMPA